jgi:multiple sugar transport system substrate-binding protein
MLKDITAYAQQGFATAANDECAIALQQDTAAMGLQWATRALSMDDPKQSQVVGKIEWAVPPRGHQPLGTDGYAISAFSKQDPDLLFRILATATSKQNLRGAAGMMVPTRTSLLQDPELSQKYRYYPAAMACFAVGEMGPKMPEFFSVADFVARGVLQAIAGEKTVKVALDEAATQTEAFLKGHGYYR